MKTRTFPHSEIHWTIIGLNSKCFCQPVTKNGHIQAREREKWARTKNLQTSSGILEHTYDSLGEERFGMSSVFRAKIVGDDRLIDLKWNQYDVTNNIILLLNTCVEDMPIVVISKSSKSDTYYIVVKMSIVAVICLL